MNFSSFRLVSAVFYFLFFTAKSQVVINEYSCANISGPQDNYSQREDWIELYNAGGSSVNIAGYYLSDKKSNPIKWQIPSGTIAAGGFMIFWASGRDTVVGSNRHTNFKLTQTKPEWLGLANASGTIIDSLTLKPTLKDNSRGRTTNGAATWSVFTTVTNGTSNNNPQQEYATKPTMSLAPGFYSGTQTVTITTPDANVSIRYTTNGASPISSSALYTGPVTISTTTVLRAKAFSSISTIPSSFVESNTYFINSPHTIPVFSVFGGSLMTLMNGSTSATPETGLEYFDKTGLFKTESYGTSNKHGNDSWSYDQRGIDFITRDQYGYNYALRDKLFNEKLRTEYQRIILKASAGDNYPFETNGSNQQWGDGAPEEGACHIRDQYVHTLSQRGGLALDERTWEPCVMYVNGQYWGVYDLREKVDDNDFLDYYYDQYEKYDGSSQYVQFLKTWGGTWSEFGGAQAQTDWDNLVNFITTNNMANAANFAYVDGVYNWKSLIDYFVLNSYVVTSDWLNWNTAWWRGLEPNGDKKKWRYVLWDMDATFGHYVNYTGVPDQNPTADPCNPEQFGDPGGQGHVPILNALMDNPTFYQYYVSRYIDLSNTVFQCSYMIALLDSMIGVIQPEMQAQITKWAPGVCNTCSMNDWLGNVQELKNFINDRCAAATTGMTDCYQVTGPYNLTVDVTPAGAGTVTVNSVTPANYPYNGMYYGNINIILNANAATGYVFDYWSSASGDTINPDTLNPSAFFNIEGQDTIIAHFLPTVNLVNLTVLVSPTGGGKVDLNGTLINTYPYNNSYSAGTNFGIIAVPNPNFSFAYWTLNNNSVLPDIFSDTASFTLNSSDTLVAYFDSVPPPVQYNLTVLVSPNGGGKVNLDGILLNTYPFNNVYNTGTLHDIIGIPNLGYNFINWTLNNNIITPNNFSDTASFILNSSDTLVAYFDSLPPPVQYNLTVLVSPNGGGKVNLDGILLNSYPFDNVYAAGTLHNIAAVPNPGYNFINWTLNNNSINPNNTSINANFNLNANDTLIAYFDSIPPVIMYDLTLFVSPPLSGNIDINGTVPGSYPYTNTYSSGTAINMISSPNTNFTFNHWELLNHTLSPNNTDVSVNFTINSGDTVIAFFDAVLPPVQHQLTVLVNPPASGNVQLDGVLLSNYPYTAFYNDATNFSFAAIASANFEFDHWTSVSHPLNPDTITETVSLLNFTNDETVTAHFKEIEIPEGYKGIYVPTGFSPNGDNNNDVLLVLAGKDVESFVFKVYDRWGNEVFSTNNAANGWNGTYKGKKAEAGVYAYQLQVKFTGGSEQTKGGDITLVR